MGDAGYALPDLHGLRRAWETRRDALFAPAPWFGRGGAQLQAAQTRRPTAVDPRDVTRLRHTVRRLELLADAGEQEVRALGEPVYDSEAPGVTGRAQIERWNAWARSWDARLGDALRELPTAPPLDAEGAFVLAHQNTARAARQLLAEHRAALANAPD